MVDQVVHFESSEPSIEWEDSLDRQSALIRQAQSHAFHRRVKDKAQAPHYVDFLDKLIRQTKVRLSCPCALLDHRFRSWLMPAVPPVRFRQLRMGVAEVLEARGLGEMTLARIGSPTEGWLK